MNNLWQGETQWEITHVKSVVTCWTGESRGDLKKSNGDRVFQAKTALFCSNLFLTDVRQLINIWKWYQVQSVQLCGMILCDSATSTCPQLIGPSSCPRSSPTPFGSLLLLPTPHSSSAAPHSPSSSPCLSNPVLLLPLPPLCPRAETITLRSL